MTTEIASLILRVNSLEARAATEDVRRLGRAAGDTENRFKGFGRTIAGLGIGTAIGAAITGVVRATIESEKAQAQLEARIRSTGGAAGLTARELEGMATSLMNVTTFGDEAIMEAQALMLTFTKIGRDVFPAATAAVLDMSTAMGTDLRSTTLQLGKALNDPVKGITALSRAGVQFSNDQKALIKSLVETGRTADAQRLILSELETQMGGAAEAARNTLGGAVEGLKNSFGELLEGDTGGEGVKGATASINNLTNTLNDPQVKEGFQTVANGVISVTAAIGEGIGMLASYIAQLKQAADLNAKVAAGQRMKTTEDANARLAQIGARRSVLEKQLASSVSPKATIGGEDKAYMQWRIENKRAYDANEELAYLTGQRKKVVREYTEAVRGEMAATAVADAFAEYKPGANAPTAPTVPAGGEGATKAAAKAAEAAAKARREALEGLRADLRTEEEAIRHSYEERQRTIAETTAAGSAERALLSQRSVELRDQELSELRQRQGAELEDIRLSLRTQEEEIQESYTRRLAIINAASEGNEVLAQQLRERETARRDEDLAALAAAEEAKREQVWQGLMTEEEMMLQWHQRKKDEILRATLDTETERQELLRREEERFMKESAMREAERISMITGSAGDMFGALAGLMKTYAQDSSKESKRLFKVAQAFSIAQAIISIATGISKAQELGYPMNIFESIRVAAVGATQIATIKGQQYSGAYDQGGMIQAGKYGVVGEYGPELVRGPAMVKGRELTARGGLGGGGGVQANVYVTVHNDGSTEERGDGGNDAQAQELANTLRATVRDEMVVQQKPGGILWRMNNG